MSTIMATPNRSSKEGAAARGVLVTPSSSSSSSATSRERQQHRRISPTLSAPPASASSSDNVTRTWSSPSSWSSPLRHPHRSGGGMGGGRGHGAGGNGAWSSTSHLLLLVQLILACLVALSSLYSMLHVGWVTEDWSSHSSSSGTTSLSHNNNNAAAMAALRLGIVPSLLEEEGDVYRRSVAKKGGRKAITASTTTKKKNKKKKQQQEEDVSPKVVVEEEEEEREVVEVPAAAAADTEDEEEEEEEEINIRGGNNDNEDDEDEDEDAISFKDPQPVHDNNNEENEEDEEEAAGTKEEEEARTKEDTEEQEEDVHTAAANEIKDQEDENEEEESEVAAAVTEEEEEENEEEVKEIEEEEEGAEDDANTDDDNKNATTAQNGIEAADAKAQKKKAESDKKKEERKEYLKFLKQQATQYDIEAKEDEKDNEDAAIGTASQSHANLCQKLKTHPKGRLYSVWTYPTAPPLLASASSSNASSSSSLCGGDGSGYPPETILCAYQPCVEAATAAGLPVERIPLRSWAMDTPYQGFVLDHMYHKSVGGEKYAHHVQAVTVLLAATVYNNKDDNDNNNNDDQETVCVRHWIRGNGDVSKPGQDDNDAAAVVVSWGPLICGAPEAAELMTTYDPALANFNHTLPPPTIALPKPIRTKIDWKSVRFNVIDYEHRRGYGAFNSGDDLQTFSGMQFMPYINGHVNREKDLPQLKGHLIMNAWWGLGTQFPPNLNQSTPSLISMHMSGSMKAKVVPKHKKWFQQYARTVAPVGARDMGTLRFLRDEMGIPAYLSLCFTLMTNLGRRNLSTNQRDKIIIMDVHSYLLPKWLKKDKRVVYLSANIGGDPGRWERYTYAYRLLEQYASRAMVVITSRIHSALPASAQGTPVIFVSRRDEKKLPGGGNGRTAGISDLFHEFFAEDHLLPGKNKGTEWEYDLEHMPPNPGVHRMDRHRASFWNHLRKRSQVYRDSAAFYQVIPLQRLGEGVSFDKEPTHDTFHFVIRKTEEQLSWKDIRAIEYVFYHHPNAHVYVHSNTLPVQGSRLDIFQEVGYHLTVHSYNVEALLQIYAKESIPKDLSTVEEAVVRALILLQYGGVSLNTDVYVQKPLPKAALDNVVGYGNANHTWISDDVMIFEANSRFLRTAVVQALLLQKRQQRKNAFQRALLQLGGKIPFRKSPALLDYKQFYPLAEQETSCFTKRLDGVVDNKNITTFLYPEIDSYTVHLNHAETAQYEQTIKGTHCDHLLYQYCIFCDELHTELTSTAIATA